MKKLFTLLLSMALAMASAIPGAAQDFQSGDLLYEIISDNPPEVSLIGHVDGQNAQGELVIPATVQFEGLDYTVAEIYTFAFRECHGLTGNLVIPNTVRVIGRYAFYECDGLSGSLVFPESVSEIKLGAFCHCSGFTGTLTIPASVTEVGEGGYPYEGFEDHGAFQGCVGFDHLELPASLQSIGMQCFADCPNLTGQLVIPDGTKNIYYNAFENCTGFTGTLVIPESVEEIWDEAFMGCSGIEGLVLPGHFVFHYYDSYKGWRTSQRVFMGCEGLIHVEIPEGWEKVGSCTFENCTHLASVHLPESLQMIEGGCFRNCTGLSDINLPEGLTELKGEVFSGCTSLVTINLPKSLKVLGNDFRSCTGLTGDMVIPDLVEEVTLFTFEGCTGLSRIVLGSSINHVYEAAFNNTQLESLVIRAITPPQLERLDYPYAWDLPADLPIIVPCGTLEAYQNAEGWSEFTNISEGNTFLLRILTDDEHKGLVRVTKEPVCGDMSVEVTADPVEGNSFLFWEVNGETVSTDNPYSFELVEDTEITAVFSGMGVSEHECEVSVYPNPAINRVTVTGENLCKVEVHNLLGQKVAAVNADSNEVTIDLSGLPQGVYLVTATDRNGRHQARKLVIED